MTRHLAVLVQNISVIADEKCILLSLTSKMWYDKRTIWVNLTNKLYISIISELCYHALCQRCGDKLGDNHRNTIHTENYNVVVLFYYRFSLPIPLTVYIPRNMHTVTALLCFVVVKHWLIFPYPSGLLHWHCGNLTIAPVQQSNPDEYG